MNNKILRDLNYGVYVIGTKDNQRNVGCIANSVMQITSNPATIAISINRENYTNECIKKTNKFSISILNEESNPEIIGTFGFSSSRSTDKYANFSYTEVDNLPVINDANGYITCELVSTLETETHTIFLGKIISSAKTNDKKPMTYQYYHQVLKGQSPKNAPTYQQDIIEEIKGSRWQCQVCGYIYEGEELPADFTCPLCGQPKEVFKKIS